MVKNEFEIIRQSGQINTNNYNEMMITATKNAIIKFMKTKLNMDEKTRNSIDIEEIYPSKSETNAIIYIKCRTQDDIATITAHASNLPKAIIGDIPPTIVRHVPKEIFKRYQALEKILWQIRRSKNVLTNIRLGRLDYIIRYKEKDDDTRWNDITPMKTPNNIPLPEIDISLYKENNTQHQEETQITQKPPKNPESIPTETLNQSSIPSIPSLQTNFSFTPLSEQTNQRIQQIHQDTGTITGELRNKHRISPNDNTNTKKPKNPHTLSPSPEPQTKTNHITRTEDDISEDMIIKTNTKNTLGLNPKKKSTPISQSRT